jgi:UDP-2,3-diacylglucosamine hydrolase
MAQWLFARFHPNFGIGFANYLSRKSRIRNSTKDEFFNNEEEWLYLYCKEIEKHKHHDLYIFGHRHLPLDLPVGNNSRYINLGEWVNHFTYGEYDGENFKLLKYDGQN